MTEVRGGHPAVVWLTDWDSALADARRTRKVVLIDVWKDP